VEVWAMDINSLTWPLVFYSRRKFDCKTRIIPQFMLAIYNNKGLGNSVPAAAVKQRGRALSMMTGRKGCVGGY